MAIIVKNPLLSPNLSPLFTSMTQKIKLIVGLGNPGEKYAQNRHNIGFMCLDKWTAIYKGQWQNKPDFKAQLCVLEIGETKFILIKPQTYMNKSAEAVSAVSNFYKIKPADIYIVHDEIRLKFGLIEALKTDKNFGHNGLKSLREHFSELNLIRVGIGPKEPAEIELTQFVLANFNAQEKEKLDKITLEVCSLLSEMGQAFEPQKRSLI